MPSILFLVLIDVVPKKCCCLTIGTGGKEGDESACIVKATGLSSEGADMFTGLDG
jgi:hypothetical protein